MQLQNINSHQRAPEINCINFQYKKCKQTQANRRKEEAYIYYKIVQQVARQIVVASPIHGAVRQSITHTTVFK